MGRIKEATELCLEVNGDTGSGLDHVGVQRIRLASRPGSRDRLNFS
jgi:hypothetical protein